MLLEHEQTVKQRAVRLLIRVLLRWGEPDMQGLPILLPQLHIRHHLLVMRYHFTPVDRLWDMHLPAQLL